MFKRVLFPAMVTLGILLLSSCLTSDYNLRVIKDDRGHVTADSTTIRVAWRDSVWVAKHAKQWASSSAIITSFDNVYESPNNHWLTEIVGAGFKGLFVVEWDMQLLPVSWSTDDVGTIKRDIFDYFFTTVGFADCLTQNISAGYVTVTHATYGTCYVVNVALVSNWGVGLSELLYTHNTQTLTNFNETPTNLNIAYFLPYMSSTWLPNLTYSAELSSANADPLSKGYGIGSYTAGDLTEFNTHNDNFLAYMRLGGNDSIVYGSPCRLDDSTAKLADRSIIGVFFEDVNPSNISSILSTVSTYRSAYTPIDEQDSIMFIAGVKNDVYHETEPVIYGELINDLIQAGVYFTPGANDDYFDYPNYQPGNWWIRSDDDSNWQNNPNNPTYASYAVGPRKLFGLVVNSLSLNGGGFPLGGHLWSSAIGHNESYMVVGGDVGGIWTSMDGGLSWQTHNYGLVNEYDMENYYGRGLIAVKNSSFEGFILASDAGLWTLTVPFTATTEWQPMYDVLDKTRLSYRLMTWGDTWYDAIPFGSIAWDGDDLLVATAGRQRYNNFTYHDYAYPWNIADGDSLPIGDNTAASWSGGDITDQIYGAVGLWKYDYTTPEAGWHPVEGTDSYNQGWGRYASCDVAIVAGDTLYVVATKLGPKLYDTGVGAWVDISSNTTSWFNHGLSLVNRPNFGRQAETTTRYTYAGPAGASSIGEGHVTVLETINNRLPSTGTIYISSQNYAYTSYSNKTFVLSGTITNSYTKGYTVQELTDTQSCWSVAVTDRGDIYCAVDNNDQTWNGNAGIWRMAYGQGANYWVYVGNSTEVRPTDNQAPASGNPVLTIPELMTGDWTNNPLSANYSTGSNVESIFSDSWTTVRVVEGSGTDPDTLYAGGNSALVTGRAEVGYSNLDARNTVWDLIISRDYATDYGDLIYNISGDGTAIGEFKGIPNNWAMPLIHRMAVDPENTQTILGTFGDRLLLSNDSGTTWSTVGYNTKANNSFISTGVDEQCGSGFGVLSDGRVIVSSGDVYAQISEDDSWTYYQRFTPLGDQEAENFEDCSTGNSDDILYGPESGAVEVLDSWNGDTDDYILFVNADVIQNLEPSKIFLVHDNNADGDFYDAGEWDCITETLTNANRYQFIGNLESDGNTKIWGAFIEYTNAICGTPGAVVEYGVMEMEYSGGTWSFTVIDPTSISGWAARPEKLAYDSNTNRLWMTAGFYGGLYFADLDDVTPTWTCIFGADASASYSPWNQSRYEDVNAIALSADGSHLYWGSIGGAGKEGGLWRITNQTAADPTTFNTDKILNDDSDANSLYAPLVSATNDWFSKKGILWDTIPEIAIRLIKPEDIVIDPTNEDRIWWMQGENYNRINSWQGVYAFDVANNEMVQILPDEQRTWASAGRVGHCLVYTDRTTPARIIWATQCQGTNWVEYNGQFHTQ